MSYDFGTLASLTFDTYKILCFIST